MMIAAALSPIYVAFVLLTGLLLWFVIGARGKWQVKLPMIIAVPVFMFVVWSSLSSFSGWPTSNPPPKQAYYVYGYVIEPDKNVGIKGAIYVWLIPASTKHGVLDYAPKQGEPRAYVLPYSKQLHGEIQAANAAVAQGKPVAFGKASSKGKTGKPGSLGRSGTHQSRGGFHAYPLPTPRPPLKGTS